jgi:hypothetical protein
MNQVPGTTDFFATVFVGLELLNSTQKPHSLAPPPTMVGVISRIPQALVLERR